MEAQFMNADQVLIFELICPRFWMEQAKNWRFIRKKSKIVKNGSFFRFCDKIKGSKGEITT